jgi:hypothetical protein
MATGKVYAGESIPKRMDTLGMVTAAAALLSIGLGILFHYCWTGDHTILKSCILSAWVIGVPAWFALEYFYIYKKYGIPESQGGSFDHFKHGQDVATKAWLAIITVLTGLYFGKDIPFFPNSEKHVVVLECKQSPCSKP